MIKLIVITLLMLSFFSCHTEEVNQENKALIDTSIVIQKYIPQINGRPDIFYKMAKQRAYQLRLDSLELGYDSLQIRIWYDYSLISLRRLVIIKNEGGKWSAKAYRLLASWYNGRDSIYRKESIPIEPKSGWNDFLKSLFKLPVMTLPNEYEIGGGGGLDGNAFSIEVATKNRYRFYSYENPSRDAGLPQVREMDAILTLVQKELGIKRDAGKYTDPIQE